MIESKIETETVLRDFVYLDWERVRSMSAQLLGGVPQDTTRERGQDVGARGEVQGGIPAVLKGRGEGDYRYFRTENETRSLQHYAYSLFEERLRERGMVAEVDFGFDFDEWTEDHFRDGQFVRVTGLVRLMDYGWTSTMMEALPSMMRAAHHAANIGLKQERDEGRLTRKEFEAQMQEQQQQLNELKALKLEKNDGIGQATLRERGAREGRAGPTAADQRVRGFGGDRLLPRLRCFARPKVRLWYRRQLGRARPGQPVDGHR